MEGAPIELLNVFLALYALVVVSILLTQSPAREKFSAIYILDSDYSMLNYPDKLGEVNFTIRVYNHLRERANFKVLLKLGDENTRIGDDAPTKLPVWKSFQMRLEHNQTGEIPVNLEIDGKGRIRVIAELWNADEYTGRWVQLWLD